VGAVGVREDDVAFVNLAKVTSVVRFKAAKKSLDDSEKSGIKRIRVPCE
jgi:hypothetical protein